MNEGNEEFLEFDYENESDVGLLKLYITKLKQHHEVEKERARETCASLIQQINDYKELLDIEKIEIEKQLHFKDKLLEEERYKYDSMIESTTREKEDLVEKIEELQKQKNVIRVETIGNLQTLMQELDNIEEINESLSTELSKYK